MCWIKCKRERDSSPESAPRVTTVVTRRTILVSSNPHSLHSRRSSHHSPRPSSRTHSHRSHHSVQLVPRPKDEYRVPPIPNPGPSDEYRIQPYPDPRPPNEYRIQPYPSPSLPKPSEYIPAPLPTDPTVQLPIIPLQPQPRIVQASRSPAGGQERQPGERVSTLIFDETSANASRHSSLRGRRQSTPHAHRNSNEDTTVFRTSAERRSINRSSSRGRSASHVRMSPQILHESHVDREFLSPTGDGVGGGGSGHSTRDASRDRNPRIVVVEPRNVSGAGGGSRGLSVDGRNSGAMKREVDKERRKSFTAQEVEGGRTSRTRIVFETEDGRRRFERKL